MAPMDAVDRTSYYLEPGYIYFSKSAATVRMVMGSCVAVCLWDRRRGCGGVAHFMYPRAPSRDEATPRYGNVAAPALVRLMEEGGCRREDLAAQILGGAARECEPAPTVGAANADAAREALERKGVAVISEDVGGTMGRKVLFDTVTGECVVLKVHRLRAADWAPYAEEA